MPRAHAIIFDVDDTLYDLAAPYRRAFAEIFADRPDLDVDELFKLSRVKSDEAFELLSAGKITSEDHVVYRVQATYAAFGVEVSRPQALAFLAAYARAQEELALPPETADLLDACVASGLPLGVISNGASDHQRQKMRSLGVMRWVSEEHVVISGDIGMPKPEPALYAEMERRLGVSGAGVWYVGDTYETDVVGAKRAGWSCIWLDRRGRPVPDVPEQPDLTVTSVDALCAAVKALL